MLSSAFSQTLRQSLHGIPLHTVFFILFLFALPLSIRDVLAVFSPDGSFNEYLDVSVYLSDLLLLATLLVFILENKQSILSIGYWRRMFHVEQLLLPIFIPFLLILWSGLSILWSENTTLALATFFYLVLSYILYLYVILCNVPRGTNGQKPSECSTWNNPAIENTEMFHVEHSVTSNSDVPRGTFLTFILGCFGKCSTWNIVQVIPAVIIISAVFQSIVVILQFISQKSIGLSVLKESIFSVYDPGVAKIIINGDVFIRAYGLFPHPNILGGFLAISLLVTMAYPLMFRNTMFHVEHPGIGNQNVPRGTISHILRRLIYKCSTWNIAKINSIKMFHVEHILHNWLYYQTKRAKRKFTFVSLPTGRQASRSAGKIGFNTRYKAIIFIQLLALFLSFSKSAILAFIIGLIWLVFGVRKMFHVEHLTTDIPNVPRGTLKGAVLDYINKCSTWNNFKLTTCGLVKKMFHVEHLVIAFVVIITGVFVFSLNLKLFIAQPAAERLFYMQSLASVSSTYSFEGLGIGQFVFDMQRFFDEKLLSWQFQPIHNVFLLIFSELGIVGLGLFTWFLIYVFLKNNEIVPRGTLWSGQGRCSTWNILATGHPVDETMFHVEQSEDIQARRSNRNEKIIAAFLFRSLLVVVIVIMCFDHYFWDIRQGQLLLWIILALAVSRKRYC
ncbi:MAG: O-antigen ligase family protein [Patescibacteria group bacterium]